jgi:hypothetical protein
MVISCHYGLGRQLLMNEISGRVVVYVMLIDMSKRSQRNMVTRNYGLMRGWLKLCMVL